MANGKIIKLHGLETLIGDSALLKLVLRNLAAAFAAFLFGCAEGMFSCYPLGISLLAAVNRHTAAVYMGLMVSSLFSKGYAIVLALIYTAEIVFRVTLALMASERKLSLAERLQKLIPSEALFGEAILLRCSASTFAAFAFGLYRLVLGGFLYYDLFGLLTAILLCPSLTLGMTMFFSREEYSPVKRRIGGVTLLICLIYSLRGYDLLGFSPSYIVSMLVTLCVATGGGLGGCAAGLLVGLAGEYDPTIFAAAGLALGLLWKLSKLTAGVAGTMLVLALGLYNGGLESLVNLLPDTLGTMLLFIPIAYYGLLPRLPMLAAPSTKPLNEAAVIEQKQSDTALRMNSLSEALGRLSEIIYTLSDRLRRPGIVDLRQVCDSAFDEHCRRCALSSLCLEREFTDTLDARAKMTAELYKSGKIDKEALPGWLNERCRNLERIISEIELGVGELIEGLIRNDKTEAFAIDYESLSHLLAESIAENDAEYRIDSETTERLARAVRYTDIPNASVICWGSRRKQVILSDIELSRLRLGAEEIRTMTENILHTSLSRPKFKINGEKVEVSMSSRRRFSVETAHATSIKENESANGDTSSLFETREDYYYSIISDGMGSGREAAIASKLCTVFLEQLLGGGNSKSVTLEMLHGFLRSRPGECSATIDMVEIDLICGRATFVKSGAAPSFVRRNGNLYKLESKTIPIGIVPSLDAEQIRFELMEGDIIVMLSDGVAQSIEDGIWLADMLTYDWHDDLDKMAEKIIDAASFNNPRSDDMTVILLRIAPDSDQQ